jgi:hypothetical protein
MMKMIVLKRIYMYFWFVDEMSRAFQTLSLNDEKQQIRFVMFVMSVCPPVRPSSTSFSARMEHLRSYWADLHEI